jgi:sporulation protein YlmC with PRC-barrel domain
MRTRSALSLATLPLLVFEAGSAAVAQSSAPSAQPPAEIAPGPLLETTTSDWRASKLIGATMTNVLNESVGTVEDVVIDADGKVVAVLVSVGGFLGLGETTVAIGLRHLIISHVDVDQLEVKTSLSRKAIEQAAAADPKAADGPLPDNPEIEVK